MLWVRGSKGEISAAAKHELPDLEFHGKPQVPAKLAGTEGKLKASGSTNKVCICNTPQQLQGKGLN